MSKYRVGMDKTKPKGWKKKFQGYFDSKKKESLIFPESCEYVIEKLAVKCLRSSIIAISDEELSEAPESEISIHSETSSSSVELPPRSFAKSIKKLSTFPKNLSIKQSKNFNVDDCSVIPRASSSKPLKKIQEKSEMIINQFTAFHPDLKDSERPPKESTNPKLQKSTRSFAEELSEIASRNIQSLNPDSELENEPVLASKSPSTSG